MAFLVKLLWPHNRYHLQYIKTNFQRSDLLRPILFFRSNESKAYTLIVDNKATIVYCQMTTATSDDKTCEDGGWTLVMKIDGNEVLPKLANVP